MNIAGASVSYVTVTVIDTNIAARLDDLRELFRMQRSLRRLTGLNVSDELSVAVDKEILTIQTNMKAVKDRILAFVNQ